MTRVPSPSDRPAAAAEPAQPGLPTMPFRVTAIAGRTSTHVRFRPSAPERRAIAQILGLVELPMLEFDGDIRPSGKRDMVLEGKLVATVVQPCSISLEPVTTKISDQVKRRFIADYKLPEDNEVEIPEDDSIEALPEVIDAAAVTVEALALALPLYPRAPGVELGEAVFTEPGASPLRDGDLKPFAGLAGLVAKARDEPDPKE
ncbi:MAG: YceD family protein [Cypionkella sp.]